MLPEIGEKLTSCLVPSSQRGNDFGLTEKDFAEYKSTIDSRLSELGSQISYQAILDDPEVVSSVLVLCGQHSSSTLWTTELSLQWSSDTFKSIATLYENAHSQPIFLDFKIVKTVISLLRPHLLASTFRCNPAATICYGWFLKKMQYSIVSDFLQDLLPTALILADDYEPKTIKLGLESLHHIIANIATEKLKWYGYDDVILDLLKKCLYLREADIVSAHMECFITLMSSSLHPDTTLSRSSFDDIVHSLLVNMYMEQKLDLRRVYATYLPHLISNRGLGVTRHLTIIFKILSEYTVESSTTARSLKAMVKIVEVCWCRGDPVGENVLVIMMKMLIASRPPSHISYSEVSPDVDQLSVTLNDAFPKVVEQFLDNLNHHQSSVDPNLVKLVNEIFKRAKGE